MSNWSIRVTIPMFAGEISGEAEAEVQAKEWEHTMLQENLDKELMELEKRLEQKEVSKYMYSPSICENILSRICPSKL